MPRPWKENVVPAAGRTRIGGASFSTDNYLFFLDCGTSFVEALCRGLLSGW